MNNKINKRYRYGVWLKGIIFLIVYKVHLLRMTISVVPLYIIYIYIDWNLVIFLINIVDISNIYRTFALDNKNNRKKSKKKVT